MKKSIITIAGLFFIFFSQAQEIGASHKLNASIGDYDSYTWTKTIDQIPTDKIFLGKDGVMVFNNSSTRSMIKDAIMYELDAHGYDHRYYNYDMIVQFMVTEQPGELTTYNGYQVINSGFDTVRTEDNVEKIKIDAGTLLINIIDAKTSQMLWQGYASGILKPEMANSESSVRQAVSSIFDKFKYKGGMAGK